MAWRWTLTLVGLTIAGAAWGATNLIDGLAGVYKHRFTDAFMDGEKYQAEDVIEIVKISPATAYLRIHLDYANGHSCAIYGVADLDGSGLVYKTMGDSSQPCILHVRPKSGRLAIDDGGTCQSFCGARGTLSSTTLLLSSKRQIGYMPRLLKSQEYAGALAERNKEAVHP